MRSTNKALLALGMAVSAGCIASPALAQSTAGPTQMAISAEVVASCTIDAVDPISLVGLKGNAAGTSSADIDVTCTNGTGYDVLIDNGAHFAGGTRNLILDGSTTEVLPYGLFTAGDYATSWPAVAGGTPAFEGTGESESQTVYLQVPAAAVKLARAGNYSDTVNVTVEY